METIKKVEVLVETHRYFSDGFRGWIVVITTLIALTLFITACTPETVVETVIVEVEKECACAGISEFPTGRFVREDNDKKVFEFDEEGNYRAYEYGFTITGKYCVNGNLFTEMTFDVTSEPIIPATYTWTYDGQKLTFHLVGEDVSSDRQRWYDGVTFIKDE